MSDRDAAAARMASYAFLASLVLATIRRMRLAEAEHHDASGLLDADDRIQFERLKDVLLSSWRGAELSGTVSDEPEGIRGLTPDPRFGTPSVTDELQTFSLVSRLVPTDFEGFVPRATLVLDKLYREPASWDSLHTDEKQFVAEDLDRFLDRLKHGAELVDPVPTSHATLV